MNRSQSCPQTMHNFFVWAGSVDINGYITDFFGTQKGKAFKVSCVEAQLAPYYKPPQSTLHIPS